MDSQPDMQSGIEGHYAVGQVLLGKYRIERVIGQGGMGLVLGATHVELQHRVAIKVLLPYGPGGETFEARFLREAQAAASLRSENVVRVYDVGRIDGTSPYMVMEWLEGRDLSSGPLGNALPAEEAVDYVVQACDAMAVAHARNLVHRDLKPANLFLSHDEHGVPTIKVLDFGISKQRRTDEPNLALTEANGVMGSPLYMAPEQARSARDVDARADIWSLGTILYELLTGVPPFNGETLGAVFMAVAASNPRPLTELRPDLPQALEAVINRCLEKEPDKRFQRAQDLQLALLPFASTRSQAKMAMRSSSSPPPGVLSSAPPMALPATLAARTTGGWSDSELRPSRPRARRRGIVAGVLTFFGLCAVSLVGWSLLRKPTASPAPAEVPSAELRAVLSAAPSADVLGSSPGTGPASAAASVVPVVPDVNVSGDPNSSKPAPQRDSRPTGPVPPRATPSVANTPGPVAPPPAPKATASAVKRNPLDIQFK